MGTLTPVAPAEVRYGHISQRSGVRAGKACIDGTRIAVVDIVSAHRAGVTPDAICTHFSSRPLSLGEVHAALAYAYDHPEEIEAYFDRERETSARIESDWAAYEARHGGRVPERPEPDAPFVKPFPWPPRLGPSGPP